MTTEDACPRCGATNPGGWRFCVTCGSPNAAAGASVAGTLPPSWQPGYDWQSSDDIYRGPPKEVERTRAGLLLLLAGALLGWIPVVSLIGSLLTLIGVILIILGRRAFGEAHTRNVVASVVLFVVGIIAVIFLVFSFAASVVPASGGTPTPAAVRAAFDVFLWGVLVATAATTEVASVLFTYALQKTRGKILLWAAYASSVVLLFAIIYLVGPAISEAVSQAFQGGTYNSRPILAAANQTDAWSLLNVVPSLMFAAANYLAWKRIVRGEIPEPSKYLT